MMMGDMIVVRSSVVVVYGVTVLITPKIHESGTQRPLLYCYEKIKRLYAYYSKTFKAIIFTLLGSLLTMICFEIFYSLIDHINVLRL